jgi:hypothetical protein
VIGWRRPVIARRWRCRRVIWKKRLRIAENLEARADEISSGAARLLRRPPVTANKVLGDAGETAQQAWSQASEVAEDVVDAGRRATKSVSRQIGEHPVISVLVACTLGYIAGWWIHGRTADHEEP